MQFDKTRIAIRERQYVDILDLALRVIRACAGPLVAAFAAGVVPMMLFNGWLLSGLADADFFAAGVFWYMLLMLLLVFLEAPLATAPATLYLGKAMFHQRPEWRELLQELRESLPQLLLYQGLLRWWYLRWGYLNEVILLDRNPMRAQSPGAMTTRKRCELLHPIDDADLAGRRTGGLLAGLVLFAAIWGSLFIVRGMLLGQWGLFGFFWAIFSGQLSWEFFQPMFTFYFQATLWIVACYLAVVRFLGYLDLRIRREGWEVELAMRAERARLARAWK